MVTLVLAGFELGTVLQGQEHADMSTRRVAMMFAECSLVTLAVNGALFLTGMLEKISAQALVGLGLVLATAGLTVMAWHQAEGWLYFGISLTSGGTGLVLPVIAYLAAGMSRHRLGSTMGLLAAAAGLGQTLGSSSGGWIFGALGQGGFGLLSVPLVVMFLLLLVRPGWWSAVKSLESPRGSAHLAPDGP